MFSDTDYVGFPPHANQFSDSSYVSNNRFGSDIIYLGLTSQVKRLSPTPTLCFLKILFIFRESGRKGERDGEKHQSVASHMPPAGDTQACALTGSRTSNRSVQRPVFNPLNQASQSPSPTLDTSPKSWATCSSEPPAINSGIPGHPLPSGLVIFSMGSQTSGRHFDVTGLL